MRSINPLGLGIVTCVLLCAACEPSADNPHPAARQEPLEDSCGHALDGVCDEPANCGYGTDSSDCEAACAAGTTPHLLAGACAFRDPPQEPAIDPALGTPGTLNLSGHRDGTIPTTSGENGAALMRQYRLFVPSSYRADRPTPLVIFMPGHRADIYRAADYTQLQEAAERNRFIVAYAEQEWRNQAGRWAWWTDWDWRGKGPDNHPDLVYLRRLIGQIATDYTVDRSRVFATGHSRGAAMAVIAALELDDIIAAAASQSGFTEFGYDQEILSHSGRKTPMYFMHGSSDPDVPVSRTDAIVANLEWMEWPEQDRVYRRIDNVAHRWQPYLNQEMWDFLNGHPHPSPPEAL